MLGRLWSVFAYGWFFVFVLNGMTKQGGIGSGDFLLASAPWWIGKGFTVIGRFVVTGSFLPPRPETLKPYRVK